MDNLEKHPGQLHLPQHLLQYRPLCQEILRNYPQNVFDRTKLNCPPWHEKSSGGINFSFIFHFRRRRRRQLFVCVQVKPLLMHRGPAGHRRALIMEPCGVNCFRLEISQPVVDPPCQLAGNEDHQKVAQIVHVALHVALSGLWYNTKMCHNSKVICFHQHFTTYFVPELMFLSFCTDGSRGICIRKRKIFSTSLICRLSIQSDVSDLQMPEAHCRFNLFDVELPCNIFADVELIGCILSQGMANVKNSLKSFA